ncbi:TonB-dependent receptor domain-containing protein [Pedobacter sp. AW31-3R]|uniref:TonB-dependent receptor n=1 Tax=Pedobacter sp. AW31-3R TaxID=3445781 RepID=UPI003F9F9E6C
MRCSFIIIAIQLTFAGLLLAAEVKSQNLDQVKVDLSLKQATLQESLLTLQRKSGIRISFFDELLQKEAKKVTLNGNDMTAGDALRKILSGTTLSYRLVKDFIIIDARPIPAKPGRISGKITDDKGETLPGASVKIVESGKAVQTGVDGSYVLSLIPGTYTLEISYLSFQTQRVTGVVVSEGKNTSLNIALKPVSESLRGVTVTANYKKASTEGLLARQKNASEISNGISAEQISRTPDKNIGESLKRISGVSSIDNKFVIVRGIGERYNAATLDGTVLPSTEPQTRNFSFDLIPSNLVDNVVVSKTVTPDMNASFGGGLIQINTKDIPNENFISFTAGTSFNDQTTGKQFLTHKRGKYDYLGFDDGSRNFPQGLVITDRTTFPNNQMPAPELQKIVDEQSRRFTKDNFTVYETKAIPSQNYQFSIGRLMTLDTLNHNKFGFTGSLSYRNTQTIHILEGQERSSWRDGYDNHGKSYGFNTTWGALFNAGLQLGKNRFSLRNTYTHMFDNTLIRMTGFDDSANGAEGIPDRREEVDDPTFTDLLQNKITGQHHAGKVKIEWNIARTSIDRKEKDLSIATATTKLVDNDYQFFYYAGSVSEPKVVPMSRHNYNIHEDHYSWAADASVPFMLAGINNTGKVGYFGIRKKGGFDWQIAKFAQSASLPQNLSNIPLSEMIKPENMGVNGFSYEVTPGGLDGFAGKSESHAGYLMLDSRLLEKLRFVYGLRVEYFDYTEIKNPNNENTNVYEPKSDQKWQWLPSANLTYSPISSLNLRTAFSSSVVRPELIDNSKFWRYSPFYGAQLGNSGLTSTRINSFDVKVEWFPGLGEIFSASAFYKEFDKPVELTLNTLSGNIVYYIMNADHAKVYGLELEARKNMGFMTDSKILNNLYLYGNLTLQDSKVKGTYVNTQPTGPKYLTSTQNRSMYGQSPYLINGGIQYSGQQFGFNVMYNKSGFKTLVVGELPTDIEYEKEREQIDAQISFKLLKGKMEIKLNAANLLNKASIFYRNTQSYEANPDYTEVNGDRSNVLRLKPGFSNKYEEGDQITFSQRFGRTYSTSISYNF